MNIGKKITIHLDNGTVTGIRHAEMMNWTGQAISDPRNQIKTLKTWDESARPGIYFLLGISEETARPAVYIGESENVLNRLFQHDLKSDFWNEVIFFTNKDKNLTKSHIKYVESRVWELATAAKRYDVLNNQTLSESVLSRSDKHTMEGFILNMKLFLGVFGHRILEPYSQIVTQESYLVDDAEILELKSKDLIATAVITDEGIVVKSGSDAANLVSENLSKGYQELKNELIENRVLIRQGKKLAFNQDQLFTSPSQAAAVITGYPMNGRIHWKNSKGQTIKEIEESMAIQ